VQKVYAAARNVGALPNFGDSRVIPVQLDITDPIQVAAAAQLASDVDILLNNAGSLAFASAAGGDFQNIEADMKVNYFGTIRMVQAFAPVLKSRGGGAIANFSSIAGLAGMAAAAGYSASKSAVHSATQSLRTELKSNNIAVHGVYPGPIDTEMAKDFDLPKTNANVAAAAILAGIEGDQEDIFPDPMSIQIGSFYFSDPKGLERQFASM
jgi:NAD(P)-dependent dehydrogenase (short-subunit alcohol dehydrogenase family)